MLPSFGYFYHLGIVAYPQIVSPRWVEGPAPEALRIEGPEGDYLTVSSRQGHSALSRGKQTLP